MDTPSDNPKREKPAALECAGSFDSTSGVSSDSTSGVPSGSASGEASGSASGLVSTVLLVASDVSVEIGDTTGVTSAGGIGVVVVVLVVVHSCVLHRELFYPIEGLTSFTN